MLQKSRAEKRLAKEPKLSEGGEAFMPDDMSVSDSASTWGGRQRRLVRRSESAR